MEFTLNLHLDLAVARANCGLAGLLYQVLRDAVLQCRLVAVARLPYSCDLAASLAASRGEIVTAVRSLI